MVLLSTSQWTGTNAYLSSKFRILFVCNLMSFFYFSFCIRFHDIGITIWLGWTRINSNRQHKMYLNVHCSDDVQCILFKMKLLYFIKIRFNIAAYYSEPSFPFAYSPQSAQFIVENYLSIIALSVSTAVSN